MSSLPSKVIVIVIRFMSVGLNTLRAHLRAHFYPQLAATAKIGLSMAQNIFMRASINSSVLLYLRLSVSVNWHRAGLLLGLLS